MMYRCILVVGLFFLLLAPCAQVLSMANDAGPQESEDTHKLQLVVNDAAQMPATHPAAQNITYNSRYSPVYPEEAIRFKHQGTVVLMIRVDAKGGVGDVRVGQSSGYPELDASAIVAARHWMFIPAAKNGVPQPGWIRTPVNFNLAPIPPSHDTVQTYAALQKAYQAERQGDYATAYALIEPLAEQGSSGAQSSLGLFYRNGTGVARDDAQAVLWFRKAAGQGNPSAQNNLGLMYLEGRGVPKDLSQAQMWFERSALTGSAFGESNFGMTYAQGGAGGKPDYVVAYALLLASSGRVASYPEYAKGVANNLSAIQGSMSQKQLFLGKKLAERIEKAGLLLAMSSHWYGADYAIADPCKPDSNEAACDDEKYEQAVKNLDR